MTLCTITAPVTAQTHSGAMQADVMTECAVHTATLPEGSFATIVLSRPETGVAALIVLNRTDVETHITALRNAMDDAERIDQGLKPLHAAPSTRRN